MARCDTADGICRQWLNGEDITAEACIVTTIERAFQLASDGKHRTLEDIRTTLRREGYEDVHGHTTGGTITRQLKEKIDAAWRGR